MTGPTRDGLGPGREGRPSASPSGSSTAGTAGSPPRPDAGGALESQVTLELERALAAGEALAVATVVGGARHGARLIVWAGGQVMGDLGTPRLNQRVALYVEGLIERGGRERKRFVTPEGDVVVESEVRSGVVDE